MSDREAFEKWWPSVGQTIGKVAAWEAWQAAQAQTLLEVIRDDSGCPVEVRVAEALQSGEPVAWMSPNKQSLEFSRPDTVYGSHTIPLYTTPQPAVPEAEALARMFHETYESLAEVAGYETRLETRSFNLESPNGRLMVLVCAEIRKALLSAGKGGEA